MRSEDAAGGAKPFVIAKGRVAFAWEQVKANRGAAGVDGVELAEFEDRLEDHLYRVWNRMSSGSYFPDPVRGVDIPKGDRVGSTRRLGVPTVADRVAQTVAVGFLEPIVERIFHEDSYGYRPGRGPLDAVGTARRRCWRFDWVIDLDIRAFFDSVDHDLMRKALAAHLPHELRWIGLYVDRWMSAAVVEPDGTLAERSRGLAQGGPISPMLANLYLHYGFDQWMAKKFPDAPFERFADDAVVHCRSKGEAERVLVALAERMRQIGLELHADKTRIVYCADSNRRRGKGEQTRFDFLGFTFCAREARSKNGRVFRSFLPAVSDAALKRIGREVRSWQIHRHTDVSTEEVAEFIGPKIRGWAAYYGAFYPTRLYRIWRRINWYLIRWVRVKYEHLRTWRAAKRAWAQVTDAHPDMFPHWRWTIDTQRV